MELKEKLEKFVCLINALNEVEDIEFLSMALAGSKFGKDLTFNQSAKEITIEVPKYVYKEVEKPIFWYDTHTGQNDETYNKITTYTNEINN